ncbi:MAG: helix-turn-helix domain-containing protein [Gammaproteobacteria bacterium]
MTQSGITVALLAVAESTPSTLYGMADILASAGRDWSVLVEGGPATQPIQPVIVAASAGEMTVASGHRVSPQASLRRCPRPDVVAIPDLAMLPDEDIRGRHADEVAWLRECFNAGAILASACTGGFLIAETGLLQGQDATTHWLYCDAMARRYPGVHVHPGRALVICGEGGRIVMAGGGISWHDLALYLIARFLGTEAAMRVARLHLIDWHEVGQQPFATLSRSRQADDSVIVRAQEWIGLHYAVPAPVAEMVKRSGLSERSFKRRFARATGLPPLAYVHTLRLEESKHLLETSDASVEGVANEVGYEDASFFGRLFKRKVGLTPAQYRRRFGGMRRALEAKLEPSGSVPRG